MRMHLEFGCIVDMVEVIYLIKNINAAKKRKKKGSASRSLILLAVLSVSVHQVGPCVSLLAALTLGSGVRHLTEIYHPLAASVL